MLLFIFQTFPVWITNLPRKLTEMLLFSPLLRPPLYCLFPLRQSPHILLGVVFTFPGASTHLGCTIAWLFTKISNHKHPPFLCMFTLFYKPTYNDMNVQISFLTRLSLWIRAAAWCVNYELQMFSTRCFVLNQALLYLKAKFNKTEYLKSPVVLLVKLLNHSPFTASQCQQNKTNNHAFSRGMKWRCCWHWSLKGSTSSRINAHTDKRSVIANTPLCLYNRSSVWKGMQEREMYFTHMD